jgi:hypothetical protein
MSKDINNKKYHNDNVQWHSAANPSFGDAMPLDSDKSSKRRYIPSKEKIRQMARESTSGGRATCEICHVTFCMDYMRRVKISTFHTGFACVDCKKAKGLVNA